MMRGGWSGMMYIGDEGMREGMAWNDVERENDVGDEGMREGMAWNDVERENDVGDEGMR